MTDWVLMAVAGRGGAVPHLVPGSEFLESIRPLEIALEAMSTVRGNETQLAPVERAQISVSGG